MDEYADDSWWYNFKGSPILRNYLLGLLGALVVFAATGVYVKYFDTPKREKIGKQLLSATADEVTQQLGQPYRQLDANTFNKKTAAQAVEGKPVSNADVTAYGNVWLYKDTTYGYRTVFFDRSNHVEHIASTYWVAAP